MSRSLIVGIRVVARCPTCGRPYSRKSFNKLKPQNVSDPRSGISWHMGFCRRCRGLVTAVSIKGHMLGIRGAERVATLQGARI